LSSRGAYDDIKVTVMTLSARAAQKKRSAPFKSVWRCSKRRSNQLPNGTLPDWPLRCNRAGSDATRSRSPASLGTERMENLLQLNQLGVYWLESETEIL